MIDVKHFSRHDWMLVAIPATLLALLTIGIAYYFVSPAPPKKIVISTGAAQGAAQLTATRYAASLERAGVKVELQSATGSVENLAKLRDPKSGVTAAFIQTGTAVEADGENLAVIAGLYYEPIWIFYRANIGANIKGAASINTVADLKGRAIAIGAEGSGTRRVALEILPLMGVTTSNSKLVDLQGAPAAEALAAKTIDAMMMITGDESPLVRQLLNDPTIRLMHLPQATALSRRFTWLTQVTLPRGIVDLEKNIPEEDIQMVAATSQLMVRQNTHPAIATLLAQAAQEAHRQAGWFHHAGDFPSVRGTDVGIHEDAARFFRSGAPFLQRYLPFWLMVWVERAMVLLIPVLAMLIPLSQALPPIYQWRMRARIYRWYVNLRDIEKHTKATDPVSRAALLARLHELQEKIESVKVPASFHNELYDLREHIAATLARAEKAKTH